MTILRAYAWFTPTRGRWLDAPPRPAVKAMLADLEQQLQAERRLPVSMTCQLWRAAAFMAEPKEEFLAAIALNTETGELVRPLVSWFEWQHPRWTHPADPPPLLERKPVTIEGQASDLAPAHA